MKKLIVLAAVCGGIYFLGQGQGWFGGGDDEAVATYQAFMDQWIVRNYRLAQPFVVGKAASKLNSAKSKTEMKLMGQTVKTPLDAKGFVEASRVKVVSRTLDGDRLDLDLVYSASISWPGSTANRMSPKSWKRYEQKASLVNGADGWKVASFSVN